MRPGEILGFAGLVGAGRTELFEGPARPAPAQRASASSSTAARCASATRARPPTQGLTYLSEDRKGKGLHVDFGLRREPDADGAGALRAALAAAAARSARRCRRRSRTSASAPARSTSRASSLSGGNQQKLALAKVLHPQPKVVVLDEPTRGVDVGAKRDIYFLIQRLAARRAAP